MAEGSCTILVVEDQPLVRELVVSALQVKGYDVAEAWSGEQALLMIDRLRPPQGDLRLILLDLMLPYGNGLDVLQHLAVIGAYIPVVALSGNRELLDTAAQAGARATITKPFDLEELIAAVERHCPPG